MKPRTLMLLLTLVLLGHWASLAWLQRQLAVQKPLVAMVDPLFTRMVMPTRVVAVAARPKPRPARVRRRAAPAVDPAPPPSVEADRPAKPAEPSAGEALAQAAAASAPALPDQPEPAVPAPAASAAASDAATPPPETWPPDTRVSYSLKGNYRGRVFGNARVQWQRDHSRYQVRVDIRMGLVIGLSMISQGEVGEGGLLPQAYEEQFLGAVRHLAVDGGLVRFNDNSRQLAPPGLQDTASQLVELSQRYASGRAALQVGTPAQVWLARPRGMALWTYDVVEEVTLDTPELGPVQAFHLVPRPIANPSGPITAEIWFAPSLRYLPVRIRISLGDDNFVDLLVDHIEQAAQTR